MRMFSFTVSSPPCSSHFYIASIRIREKVELMSWLCSGRTGYGNHGDYVFGWKGDALQRAMDSSNCNVNCPALKTQSIQTGNKCTQKQKVKEEIDGCEFSIYF